jgi:AbiV family abortive infection protein
MEDELFTKEFCLKGYKLAIDNAKSLYKVAYQSSEVAEYGIANSLNILSAEEAIKAFLLITRAYYPEEDYSDFNEIFFKHGSKHKLLQSFSKALPIIKIFTSPEKYSRYILALFQKYFLMLNENKRSDLEPHMKNLETIFNKHFISNIKKPYKNENFEALIEWWKEANKKKNKGLYVGIENKKWQFPQNFSEEEFELSSEMTHTIIAYTVRMKRFLVKHHEQKNKCKIVT